MAQDERFAVDNGACDLAHLVDHISLFPPSGCHPRQHLRGAARQVRIASRNRVRR